MSQQDYFIQFARERGAPVDMTEAVLKRLESDIRALCQTRRIRREARRRSYAFNEGDLSGVH